MTAPFRYPDYSSGFSLGSPQGQQEWDAFLQHRSEIVQEIQNRLALSGVVGTDQADQVANLHQQHGQNADGSPTMYQRAMAPVQDQHELNQLYGAAQYYGIPDYQRIPPNQLKVMVQQRRTSAQLGVVEDGPQGVGQQLENFGMQAAASLGIGTIQTLMGVTQHIPFIGNALADRHAVQAADQWFARANEGYRASITPVEDEGISIGSLFGHEFHAGGYQQAHAMGGMVGYTLAADAAWNAVGAIGKLAPVARFAQQAGVVTPWMRAGIQGLAATSLLEGGGHASNEEKALKIIAGGGFAAGLTAAAPWISGVLGRLQGSFGTKAAFGGGIQSDPIPQGVQEAEWHYPNTLAAGQPAEAYGAGVQQPAGLLPPSTMGPQLEPAPQGLLGTSQMNQLQSQVHSLREQRDMAQRMMETDQLTGIGNPRAMQRAQVVADADPSLSWVAFDARQFKGVNDALGHSAGDQALVQFAQAMRQSAQELGVPARLFRKGGDEFAAIVPNQVAGEFQTRVEARSAQDFGGGIRTKLEGFVGQTYNDADLALTARKAAGRLQLDQASAPLEGASLTKQATIMESPALAYLTGQPVLDDGDVAVAALATAPDAIHVLQGVDDPGKVLSRLTRGSLQLAPNQRIMPHEFRVIPRDMPNGQSRLDLLVSNGDVPISNKRADQYRRFGMFEGQTATVAGREVQIEKPDETMTVVRGVHDDPSSSYIVLTRDVMPGRAAHTAGEVGISDAKGLYGKFQQFALDRVNLEARAIGKQFSWYDRETATQLPALLDEFLSQEGLEGPVQRAAVESQFNLFRVADYKSLAPDEIAHGEEMVRQANEEGASRAARHPEDQLPLEDIASTKGFKYLHDPATGGGILQDLLSDLRVPVADEPTGLDFLRSFNRQVPDFTPLSDVPVEAMPHSAFSANPGADQEPAHLDGLAGHHREAEQVAEQLEQYAGEQQANQAERAAVGFGFGSGFPPNPPAPPVPPSGAAGWPPEFVPPSGVEGLSSQFRRVARENPISFHETMRRVTDAYSRWILPMRSFTLRAQTMLQDLGIDDAKLWEHYNDVSTGSVIAHNEANPWIEELADIVKDIRRKFKRDGTFVRMMSVPEHQRPPLFEKLGFNDLEIAAMDRLHNFNQRFLMHLAGERGVPVDAGQINDWLGRVRRNIAGGASNPFDDQNLPSGLSFLSEMGNSNKVTPRLMDVGAFETYMVRSAMMQKHLAGPYERMAAAWELNTPEGLSRFPSEARPLQDIMRNWLMLVRYGHVPGEDATINVVTDALKRVGVPARDADVARAYSWMYRQMYRSAQGGRLDIIARDSIQPLMSWVRLGNMNKLAEGYRILFAGGPDAQALWEWGQESGVVEKGMVKSAGAEMFGTPYEPVTREGVPYSATDQALVAKQDSRRELLARVGDLLHDMAPRAVRQGIQGTKMDPLLWYTRLGEVNRLVTGYQGREVARDAIADYTLGLQHLATDAQALGQVPQGQSMSRVALEARLMQKSGAWLYPAPIRQQFMQFIKAADYESASNLLANEAANSQFRYGTREQPPGIQALGNTGRMAMMWGNFTNQFVAWAHEAVSLDGLPGGLFTGPRAVERVKVLGRYGSVMGALGAAAAFTGWNFSKWMWHNSLAFSGGPLATGLYQGFQAATGRIAEATGQPLSPDQQYALARWRMESPAGHGPAAMLNPYEGLMRTAAGLNQTLAGSNPLESTVRYGLTGDYGVTSDYRQYLQEQPVVPADATATPHLQQTPRVWPPLPQQQVGPVPAPYYTPSTPGSGAF